MISFAEPPTQTCWGLYREYGIQIIADSGAYSVWSRGKDADIAEYMTWLKQYEIRRYFNFDVIGDQEATAENHAIMEQAGFHPIPVFHLGEPMEVLEGLVNKYPLVGLGGTVGQPVTIREQWFRQVFSLYPKAKFHAFGVTDARLIAQFPFASVDSTWWLCKYQDNVRRLAPGRDRKEEQRARIRYLRGLENKPATYQLIIF
jgi:hypothetical protein